MRFCEPFLLDLLNDPGGDLVKFFMHSANFIVKRSPLAQ